LISDRQLQKVEFDGNTLRTGGESRYQVIVLPRSRFIPLETFKKLLALARDGATIIACEGLPEDVPGLGRLEERRTQFRELAASIKFGDVAPAGVKEAATAGATV